MRSAGKNMPLRGLVLLFALMLVLLAVDAAEFGGQYRRAAWREAIRQGQILQHKAARYVDLGYS
jgi:hypothetical protein